MNTVCARDIIVEYLGLQSIIYAYCYVVGGSTDTAAKILLGICESEETVFFLVLVSN